jgi:iron complex transport system substrate-binding protein
MAADRRAPVTGAARRLRSAGFVALKAVLAVAGLMAGPATATERRFVSINLCTDHLLVALAPPREIAGLSPYAGRLPAPAGHRWPLLSGTAEDVLLLKPDLVLAGTFTRRETRTFLKAQGIPVAEFPVATSLAQLRDQIRAVAQAVQQPEAGARLISRIDAATDRLRVAAAARPLRVLPLSRRGWVEGRESLLGDILHVAGLTNAAAEAGLPAGGFVDLEGIVALKPDAILVTQAQETAPDQGSAFLLHPAIAGLFPPHRRIVVSDALTVCGGPLLVDAMDELARQIRALPSAR